MGNINLENKRVLITGGKGYLGSHLIDALKKEKAQIYEFSLEPSENEREYQVDITNQEEVVKVINEIQPQIIFHLAASLDRRRDFDNYERIMNINVQGTLNLLRALQNVDYENLIFTSSSEVYGNNDSPFREEQALMPTSPYSLSKVYGEHLIRTFSDVYNKNYTILRLFNFYGADMSESFFIPQLIKTLRRGEDFGMTKGEQVRDFIYVDDIVDALLLSAKSEAAYRNIFNVCSGKGASMKELAQEVENKIEDGGKIIYGAIPYRDNEVWEMIGDNTKIEKVLNFKIKVSLAEGIKKCIDN